MKNNILISTGGSGGHVVPATILCDHLWKDTNVIISIDKRGLKYLDANIYQHEIIDTPRLNNIFFLPLNIFKIFLLTLKSYFLLKNKKINKVFSTGGYMSLPVILAARLLRLEIYLIEPNSILGRANKYFLDYCKKIFCYTKHVKNFPMQFKNKIITINPLTKKNTYDIKTNDKSNSKFTLLVVGGSQGASIFNGNLKNSIVKISKKNRLRIIQQTSENNISDLTEFYSKNNIENKIFSFDKNIFNSIQQADLCITRAGASTLAEFSIMSIPFIAVPLPTAKDNHQFENANYYKNLDCCWLLEQSKFEDTIEALLEEILKNKSDYQKKKENLKKLNYQNTWINVNQKILRVINEN